MCRDALKAFHATLIAYEKCYVNNSFLSCTSIQPPRGWALLRWQRAILLMNVGDVGPREVLEIICKLNFWVQRVLQ